LQEKQLGEIIMMVKEKRLILHNFKTTEAEDTEIRQKMKAFGMTNQSAYLRTMALKGYLLKVNLPEIRELIRLMKNLTNNVNQIAKKLNEQGSVYETEIDDIAMIPDRLVHIGLHKQPELGKIRYAPDHVVPEPDIVKRSVHLRNTR
jgi:hypothetical protein